MVTEFFNMVLEPLYCAFSTYDLSNNLLQFALIIMVIITAISWIKYFIH